MSIKILDWEIGRIELPSTERWKSMGGDGEGTVGF